MKREHRTAPTVPCPRCREPAELSPDNPYRPFCSKRCRLIDLGAWANDEYAIPGDPLDADGIGEEDPTPPGQ